MLKDKIKELIAIIEETGVSEIEVSSWWGRMIRVTKNSSAPAGMFAPAATATPGPPIVGTAGPPARSAAPRGVELLDPPFKAATAISATITAPMPINQGNLLRVWTDIVSP